MRIAALWAFEWVPSQRPYRAPAWPQHGETFAAEYAPFGSSRSDVANDDWTRFRLTVNERSAAGKARDLYNLIDGGGLRIQRIAERVVSAASGHARSPCPTKTASATPSTRAELRTIAASSVNFR
jgi:hypothetical protein